MRPIAFQLIMMTKSTWKYNVTRNRFDLILTLISTQTQPKKRKTELERNPSLINVNKGTTIITYNIEDYFNYNTK